MDDYTLTDKAIEGGQLNLLKELVSQGHKIHYNAPENAAAGGHLDIMKYFIEDLKYDLCMFDSRDTLGYAYYRNNRPMIDYLRGIGCQLDEHTLAQAARGGHFDLVKELCEEGCRWDWKVTAAAAQLGRMDMLEWLYEEGCEINFFTASDACRGGHLHVVKWLHERGCSWCPLSYSSASEGGHIHILEYLVQEGCPRDFSPPISSSTEERFSTKTSMGLPCETACRGGQWETLRWLHERGFPFNFYAAAHVIGFNRLDLLQWMIQNGCPLVGYLFVTAARENHVHIMQWLSDNSCPITEHIVIDALKEAMKRMSVDAIDWIYKWKRELVFHY